VGAQRPSAAEIAPPLLEILRRQLDAPTLDWDEAPELLGDGVSARVFALRTQGGPPETGSPWVCRIFCDGSNDVTDAQVASEAALQGALASAGFPVPRVVLWGGATSPLGAPFMVMERVQGPDGFRVALGIFVLAAAAAFAGFWALWATGLLLAWGAPALLLRRLHRVPAVDVARALEEAGVPPERLGLERALDELAELVAAGSRPGAGRVVEWLRANRPDPAEGPAVCHGDFWYGNLMWSRRGPFLIDWTQAALGHRELDLGWMSIQHYSRFPLPVPDPLFDWLWAPVRPFVWLFMAPVRWLYLLAGGVQRQRIHYFTALCAVRVLAQGDRLAQTATKAARPAELSAWGSPHTTALLRWRLRRITGIDVG